MFVWHTFLTPPPKKEVSCFFGGDIPFWLVSRQKQTHTPLTHTNTPKRTPTHTHTHTHTHARTRTRTRTRTRPPHPHARTHDAHTHTHTHPHTHTHMGMGENPQKTTDFSPCVHFPGFHFGCILLTPTCWVQPETTSPHPGDLPRG